MEDKRHRNRSRKISNGEERAFSPDVLVNPTYKEAQNLLLSRISPVETETISLSRSGGRILAQDLIAMADVPAFDRSPYDGYAFRAEDTADASKETPVMLRILEEVPAGANPAQTVTAGTATKVLTGAPIPQGADAVIMFEKTSFTKESVTLYSPARSGENIVCAGEDIRRGAVVAERGKAIDAAISGMLASQGVSNPRVYRKPRIAIISTGSELVEAEDNPPEGKIRNSNRYTYETAVRQLGCEVSYLGIAGDSVSDIAELIRQGVRSYDMVITTGGVSVGEYDLTAEAMEAAGAKLLINGIDMKPGMACAMAVKDRKLICGLSGNPASSLTTFCVVLHPVIRKLKGLGSYMPVEIPVTLTDAFPKKSPKTRFLRGKLELSSGAVSFKPAQDQGNVVLSSAIGCDMVVLVPAGSGPLEAGTVLNGFVI